MSDETNEERLGLLADIAEWYYVHGLSQQEIAARVHLSRPSISRLLLEAKDQGIIEIKINRPIATVLSLEQELQSRFGLQRVRVVERRTANHDEILGRTGRIAAGVLDDILEDGMILGLTWGTAIRAVLQALHPRRLPNVKVVQLAGGVGAPYRQIDAPEQCRRAAEVYGAQHYYMNAPMVVDSPATAAALREDHSIKEVLELAKHTNVAIFGIGSTIPEHSTIHLAGYIDAEQLEMLRERGAVGALAGCYYDVWGNCIPAPELDACTIAVSWDDMHRFGISVAVAAGREKGPAILGALRTGIIDHLVTDDLAAEEILRLEERTSQD